MGVVNPPATWQKSGTPWVGSAYSTGCPAVRVSGVLWQHLPWKPSQASGSRSGTWASEETVEAKAALGEKRRTRSDRSHASAIARESSSPVERDIVEELWGC